MKRVSRFYFPVALDRTIQACKGQSTDFNRHNVQKPNNLQPQYEGWARV